MSFFTDVLRAVFDKSSSGPHTTAERERLVELPSELRRWVRAAFAADAEDEERRLIAQLASNAERTTTDLSRVYWRLGDDDASLRWAMVHCAARLQSPSATGFLTEVLDADIPPERSTDVHLFSTVAEEVAQRMRAIEGLAELLGTDDRAAAPLLRALRHPVFAIRAATYLAVRDRIDPARVEDAVDESDREELHALRRIRVAQLGEFGELERVDLPRLPAPSDRGHGSRSGGAPTIGGGDHG